MTPELEKEIIVACVSAFFSALFTGIPAALLFWWTYRRDQERIKVQKYVKYVDSLQGKEVLITDGAGTPALGILIRNQSLFSIRISAVGFNIDGEVIQLEDVCYPLKLKRNPDQYSNRPNIPGDSDPNEINSGTYLILETYGQSSHNLIKRALHAASTKHNISMEDLVLSNKLVALVALESGRQFDSLSLRRRLWKSVFEPLVTRGKKSWSRLRQLITPRKPHRTRINERIHLTVWPRAAFSLVAPANPFSFDYPRRVEESP